MAGTSKRNRKKRNVAVSYECPSNILPRDIWVRIAMKVSSNSIKDLFDMQATCKVFLNAARSDAVYKHASMLELPIASFLYYYDRPEKSFVNCYVEAGNLADLLRVGMIHFVWIRHCIGGMDTLTMVTTGGDVETCYFCAMLLLSHVKEDEEHLRRGLEFFEIVRCSGAIDRCRVVFRQVFDPWWVEVKPSDPGQPEVCKSTSCPTRSTMGVVKDLSRVSCVQCLADYEVWRFLESFVFE